MLRMLLDDRNGVRHCWRSFRLYSVLDHCWVILNDVFTWRCVGRLNHTRTILLGLWRINLKAYLICIKMNDLRSVSMLIDLKISISNKSGFTTDCSHLFIDNNWIAALSRYQSWMPELIWLIINVLNQISWRLKILVPGFIENLCLISRRFVTYSDNRSICIDYWHSRFLWFIFLQRHDEIIIAVYRMSHALWPWRAF